MNRDRLRVFRNMDDTSLANYYCDLCAYDDDKAIEARKKAIIVICERFVDKFADFIPSEEDYDDLAKFEYAVVGRVWQDGVHIDTIELSSRYDFYEDAYEEYVALGGPYDEDLDIMEFFIGYEY